MCKFVVVNCSCFFAGKGFTISGYDERNSDELEIVIKDHGGEIRSLTFRGQVHYSLLNLDGSGTAHPKACDIISKYFIEDCIEQQVSMLWKLFEHLNLDGSGAAHLKACDIISKIFF